MKKGTDRGGDRVKRKYLVIPGAVLVVIVILAIIGLMFIWDSASYEGTIVADVGYPVNIQRDDSGIPHIRAKNLRDAYYALGFVHAQDRILSMEILRLFSRGRYCEYTAEDKIFMDRVLRSLRLSDKAVALIEKLDTQSSDYLDAYAGGINYFKTKKLNELVTTNTIPDDTWTSSDVISIMLFLEWSNSFLSNREILFPVIDEFRSEMSRSLLQNDQLFVYGKEDVDAVTFLRKVRDSLRESLGPFGFGKRGLAFAIPSSLTQDNVPVLAFNYEHPVKLYPAWYPVLLEVEDQRIHGYTYAGMPFFYTGVTGNFSYASFSLTVDTQFFSRERIRKVDDTYQYLKNGRWHDFLSRMDVIRKGKDGDEANATIFQQFSNEQGPVICGYTDKGMLSEAVILNALYPEAASISALFEIPFAGSAGEAMKAIRGSEMMPSVFLFQDDDGNYTVHTGKVPLSGGSKDVILDASSSYLAGRYRDFYISGFTSLGIVVTGSDYVQSFPYQFRQAGVAHSGRQFNRMETLLDTLQHGVPEEIEAILLDNGSSVAQKYVPFYLSRLEKMPVTSARLSRLYFNNWDYRMDKDSVAATIYHNINSQLVKEIFSDEMPEFSEDIQSCFFLVEHGFYRMLEDDRTVFFDDISTLRKIETRDMIFDRAFLHSLRVMNESLGPYMDNWNWGRLHHASMEVPLVGKDSSLYSHLFNGDPVGLHGSDNTIMKGGAKYTAAMNVSDATVVFSYIW
ncbi:MAG: penicillin acylase family protein, partial [Spirochaetota bacterium]